MSRARHDEKACSLGFLPQWTREAPRCGHSCRDGQKLDPSSELGAHGIRAVSGEPPRQETSN